MFAPPMALPNPFRAPVFEDPSTSRAAAVLAPFLTMMVGASLVVTLSSLGVEWVLWWQHVGLLSATIGFAAMRYMVQVGHVRTAAGVTTALLLLVSTSSALNDASSAVYPLSFAATVVVGGLTLRRPMALVLAALASTIIVTIDLLATQGQIQLRRPPEAFGVGITSIAILMVLGGAVEWMLRALEAARERVENREAVARELQQGLFRAQRMQAIGRLAGGVAHDFNNLLTVVLANASALFEKEHLDDDDRAACEAIIKASEGGAGLTRQLLAMGGRQATRPARLDLGDVVEDFRTVLEHMRGSGRPLRIEVPTGLGVALADAGQVQHAVANLVINASKASHDSDEVLISLEAVHVESERVSSHGTIAAGRYLVLRVRDSGKGMDADTVAHAFDPFFTSRPGEGGTGLGLAVVHGVVTQSGGAAEIESAVGQGTTVSLWFPEVTGSSQWRPRRAGTHVADALAGMRILLVDDDAAARQAVRRILELAGASVQDFGDPRELLEPNPALGTFELAIVDVMMPGISGPDLVTRLRRSSQFEAPVLFLTGFVEHGSGIDQVPGPVSVLSKPVSPVELVRALTEVRREPSDVSA